MKCSLALICLLILITFISVFNNNYYKAFAGKNDANIYESPENQISSQKSDCKAGEDNNNSCNNISISRQDDDDGVDSDDGNKVQVSKQGSSCDAGEDNNNSCNNIDLQEMIKAKIDLLSHNRV